MTAPRTPTMENRETMARITLIRGRITPLTGVGGSVCNRNTFRSLGGYGEDGGDKCGPFTYVCIDAGRGEGFSTPLYMGVGFIPSILAMLSRCCFSCVFSIGYVLPCFKSIPSRFSFILSIPSLFFSFNQWIDRKETTITIYGKGCAA